MKSTSGHLLSRSETEKIAIVLRALEGVGNFAMRAGSHDPMGTALTAGGMAAFGPGMVRDALAPSETSQLRKMRRLSTAQQLRESKMLKSASRAFTRTELEEGLAIRRSLEKTAAGPGARTFENIVKNPAALFAAGALLSAGAATGGAASLAVSTGVGKLTEKIHALSLSKQYNDMLMADPSLKGDPKARAYFEVLHRMSPYIAGEPHIAAATIKQMVETPEGYALTPKVVSDIMGVEERRQKTRYPALRNPTLRGSEADISVGGGGKP